MFISASVGMAVAVGLVRGFKRQHSKTIGNFWVDLTRGILYILLPIAFIASIIFVAQGAVDTLSGSIFIHNPLDGFKQLILLGLNPLHQHGVTPALAFNTSVSFVTNTNWQNYSGETTMSFFSQMIALASQMFISASVGITYKYF